MRNRMAEIKAKGFDMTASNRVIPIASEPPKSIHYEGMPASSLPPTDYNKIRVGAKILDDAIMKLGDFRRADPRLGSKTTVFRAIHDYDLKTMREISHFFYRTSGIYNRIIRYMAYMYRYDWMLLPYEEDQSTNINKMLKKFYKGLKILDDYNVKKNLGEIALKVLIEGVYYGYKVPIKESVVLQDLPSNYCRSRWNQGNNPVVEFNMRYFDEQFIDSVQRQRVLNLFPKEFKRGYQLYHEGKLPPSFIGDENSWYMLDPKQTVRFTANGEEFPAFISVVPLIINLDEAQALDRKRTMQRLLKIVIQKLPMDKDGELIFDAEEAQQLHNNAVSMLSKAIGVDVLTTFAEVEVADMTGGSSGLGSQNDDLERAERQVYNGAGISQNQFNTDGNVALEKSILNDESTMYNLIQQFEIFLNDLIEPINSQRKNQFKVQILGTTQYNYKDLAKLYKENVQLGYSKMLPQIALGHSQSSILSAAYFENDVLELITKFIPPLSSNILNSDFLEQRGYNINTGSNSSSATKEKTEDENSEEEKSAGRPAKDPGERSDKTIQNREAEGKTG